MWVYCHASKVQPAMRAHCCNLHSQPGTKQVITLAHEVSLAKRVTNLEVRVLCNVCHGEPPLLAGVDCLTAQQSAGVCASTSGIRCASAPTQRQCSLAPKDDPPSFANETLIMVNTIGET